MLYVVNLHHPKATTSLLYWAVRCQSTGPEGKAASSVFHIYYAVSCQPNHPKTTTSILYRAVCCQPTGPETKAATSVFHMYYAVCCQPTPPQSHYIHFIGLYVANLQGLKPKPLHPSSTYTMLYVVNLHHPKATTSILYQAVCCQPTGPETKAATSVCHIYYAVCGQPTPPQSHYIHFIPGCMLPTYRA